MARPFLPVVMMHVMLYEVTVQKAANRMTE